MRVWPALLGAPHLALLSIVLGYALVTPACRYDSAWMLHAVVVACLGLALASTALAWSEFTKRARQEFLPLVATWTGGFFSLVIAAQGLTQLMLDPCTH
jgi:NADH:ubiquinone oxidoreductase subunit 2 (subunit N)